jgi:hypothetical protein
MLRVRVAWSGPSSPLLSTFHFLPATEDTASATTCFTAVATLINALRPHISTAFSYTVQQQVDQLTLQYELTGTFTATNVASSAGTNAGDALPRQNQGLIRWNTSNFFNGRRIIGRTFVPGPTETDNASGVPVATYVSDITAAAQVFADTNTANPVVWSARPSAAPTQFSAAAIDAGVCDGDWAILRSRR